MPSLVGFRIWKQGTAQQRLADHGHRPLEVTVTDDVVAINRRVRDANTVATLANVRPAVCANFLAPHASVLVID